MLEVETVLKNKLKFSKQDVHKAELARALQHIAGHLSEKQLLEIAQKNQLENSPITPRDVRLMKKNMTKCTGSKRKDREGTTGWSTIGCGPCTLAHTGPLSRYHIGNRYHAH